MEKAGEAAASLNFELAAEQIRQVKTWAQWVYLMPQFNRYNMVADLLEAVK